MSDDQTMLIGMIATIAIGTLIWCAIITDQCVKYERRITALEQSQCVAKDSKVHADMKFNACMSQLRGKTQ